MSAGAAVPVTANARNIGIPGADEPSLYYVNPDIDVEFDVTPMAGSGSIVSK
jgi:hypothetical protein